MKRDLLKQLTTWQKHPLRKPLILRGARQTGKSWLVDTFGKQFDNFVKIDFDKNRSATKLFQGDLDIPSLIANLSLYSQQTITPGKTLLFFDEVQNCEQAITALRYFKEELPELHVIAAGSLIDFALEKIGLPVGRVQFLYLHPLSFGEFLTAIGRDDLRQHIYKLQVAPVIHEKISQLLKNYMWLGGMPAVVDAWINHQDFTLCQQLQDEIINAYRQDFYKYARNRQIDHVDRVFAAIPAQLGHKFKFSHVDNELRAQQLKTALLLLSQAGVAHLCYHSDGQNLPLGAEVNAKRFKVYFLDLGLAQRMLGLTLDQWTINAAALSHYGAITEQLVAQELIAYSTINSKDGLYYWHREAKSSNAEVDFLVAKHGTIVPIEVKSATSGSMKSMQLFLASHKNSPYGLKISPALFAKHGIIRDIPLYGIEAWLAE